MQAVTLHKFESLCTQDSPPECQSRCPLHVEAGTLADLVGKGQIDEARKVLERFLPLASLSARLCEGVCRETCLRKDLGGSINIPLLEAYIVSVGRETKVFPLPSTGHKAALVGSGLSALAAAFELAKKGHKPFLFHKGPIGGRLKHLSAELAPPRVLEQTVESLKKLKVKFAE
ncbi:MAG: hypothetical protein LBT62_06210, partial [Deltaproteobacteria bacterium]|nr:hypothetical protein [Deltaproteobacteria bacterium]